MSDKVGGSASVDAVETNQSCGIRGVWGGAAV